MRTRRPAIHQAERERTRVGVLGVLLTLPLVGLALLLVFPALDVRWQHQPSHFWLVLGVALVNVVLGLVTSDVADRRGDVRLFLVSLVLLVSAGFLGLHALATPSVVLQEQNVGFTIATPVGLLLASALAAASALDLQDRHAAAVGRHARALRIGLLILLVGWAVASLARVPVLDQAPQEETPPLVRALAPVAIAMYTFAAVRYLGTFRRRRRTLPLAVAVAFILLAEAMVAVVFSRTWHATWWEWHLLMAIAFMTIFLAARREYRREGSVTATFSGLYLEGTLERVDRRSSEGLSAYVEALRAEEPVRQVADHLRAQGFGSEELQVLERSARDLVRVDDLFRSYVGPRLAERLTRQPALTRLGGREIDVSVLFADLAGFTSFSENRAPDAVLGMLNSYWEAAVPTIVGDAGGMIERFAGDAIMAVFNALNDQPDHPLRAVRAALNMRDAITKVAEQHPQWPRFRIGINTGPALIGNVGTGDQHSFSAIGDTPNVAARVQAIAEPGEVLLAASTYQRVRDRVRVEPRGAIPMKGKSEPVEVYELLATLP